MKFCKIEEIKILNFEADKAKLQSLLVYLHRFLGRFSFSPLQKCKVINVSSPS